MFEWKVGRHNSLKLVNRTWQHQGESEEDFWDLTEVQELQTLGKIRTEGGQQQYEHR